MIGSLLISQVMFSKDKKEACFVYEYEEPGKKHKGKIGYIEVIYKKNSWFIAKHFKISKGNHRLIG